MKILVFLSHFTLQDGPCPSYMTPGLLLCICNTFSEEKRGEMKEEVT